MSLRGDRRIKDVAKDLGISEWALYRWRCDHGPRPGRTIMAAAPRSLAEAEEEIRRLRAENARMRGRESVLNKPKFLS